MDKLTITDLYRMSFPDLPADELGTAVAAAIAVAGGERVYIPRRMPTFLRVMALGTGIACGMSVGRAADEADIPRRSAFRYARRLFRG